MKPCLNREIKVVVCDIDGTLTRSGEVIPSPYTLDVIERLHAKGIEFGIASGRSVPQLVNLRKKWGLSFDFDLVIGLNGSELFNKKTGRHDIMYGLTEKDIEEVITTLINRYPYIKPSMYRDGKRQVIVEDEAALFSKFKSGMDNHVVEDISEFWSEPCSKIMFRSDNDYDEEFVDFCHKFSNERFKCAQTQSNYMEFVNANASKGSVLESYCKINGVDINNVAAFGDMPNDNEMLEAAGLGVVMINGMPETKAYADVETEFSNDEDGCAKFIEKYILNEQE